VFLRGLVPPARAVEETVERERQYRAAGADGLFAPRLSDPQTIRDLVAAVALPLNVMVVADLPPVAELERLGVRRVSAGSAIAQLALGSARRAAAQLLRDGRYDAMLEASVPYGELNALFPLQERAGAIA
jgi:2-methylisocitrate lyase-like PEP mutase family enzyme